jgi:hypothetical protein
VLDVVDVDAVAGGFRALVLGFVGVDVHLMAGRVVAARDSARA